ncbi:MAG: hypothetical protein LBF57_01520 [Holosporaceae bacterium]|jgi:mevalonate kinase|nr:hypothetical protein [Holosporaceae bacterium]
MIFSTGSKTFLVGEYSVLFGGSAIVLITPPNFLLTVKKSVISRTERVNECSPASVFYKDHDFENLHIDFQDPHGGKGGFGASSAQFALFYQLYLKQTNQKFNPHVMLQDYRKSCGKIHVSGADCFAQFFNHHIFFDSKTTRAEKINWNFSNLDFAIFKTNTKVATHLHLQKLNRISDISDLENATIKVKESLLAENEELFAKNVQVFFYILQKKGLVIDRTSTMVEKLLKIDEVRAAKGCGALSADTIIVIFYRLYRNAVMEECKKLGLGADLRED